MKQYTPYPSWWPFKTLGRAILETMAMDSTSLFLLHILSDEIFEELISRFLFFFLY